MNRKNVYKAYIIKIKWHASKQVSSAKKTAYMKCHTQQSKQYRNASLIFFSFEKFSRREKQGKGEHFSLCIETKKVKLCTIINEIFSHFDYFLSWKKVVFLFPTLRLYCVCVGVFLKYNIWKYSFYSLSFQVINTLTESEQGYDFPIMGQFLSAIMFLTCSNVSQKSLGEYDTSVYKIIITMPFGNVIDSIFSTCLH